MMMSLSILATLLLSAEAADTATTSSSSSLGVGTVVNEHPDDPVQASERCSLSPR